MDKKMVKQFAKVQERRLREMEEREEFQAICDHKVEKKNKVKSTLKPVEGKSYYKCSVCGARVSLDPVSKQDLKEACDTIMTVLQQFKVVQDELPMKVLQQVGFIGQFIPRLDDLYDDTRQELYKRQCGGNETHSYNDFDEFGAYAAYAKPLTLGDYAKHKNKHKGKNKKKNKKKNKSKWY